MPLKDSEKALIIVGGLTAGVVGLGLLATAKAGGTQPPTTTYYTLTASADANSSISPSGSFQVPIGSSQTYIYAAASGYVISQVFVDGSSKPNTGSYTFTNITANHTISVTSVAVVTPPPIPGPPYVLDVGITVFGNPTYFSLSDAIAEFVSFIQARSKFILNIHLVYVNQLLNISEFTAPSGTTNCVYPNANLLFSDSTVNQYFIYPVNILLFDDEGTAPCYGGLTWIGAYYGKSVVLIPFGSNIAWWISSLEANWNKPYASVITHEFLNAIGVCADCNCTPWGYTSTNDPGWINFYTALLSYLTDADYEQILNGQIPYNFYANFVP